MDLPEAPNAHGEAKRRRRIAGLEREPFVAAEVRAREVRGGPRVDAGGRVDARDGCGTTERAITSRATPAIFSSVKGLRMKCCTPAVLQAMIFSRAVNELQTTTRASGCLARSSVAAVTPSISGITMSSMMRSGLRVSYISITCVPRTPSPIT